MSAFTFRVLLADDDEEDRLFFSDAIHEIDQSIQVDTVPDGEQLMLILSEPSILLPDILFLDINMPCKNGKECLKEIRTLAHLVGAGSCSLFYFR